VLFAVCCLLFAVCCLLFAVYFGRHPILSRHIVVFLVRARPAKSIEMKESSLRLEI
jgi:hypothetical protein